MKISFGVYFQLCIKNFNIIKPKLAIDFGFDKDPKELFKINKGKLPFGCHNCWNDENNDFWKNYF